MTNVQPVFQELGINTEEALSEIESLCMNCHANGITRLLLTKIPFYKDVILMSFTCDECGYQNNELQSGSPAADKGIKLTLLVKETKDLNRQVVKSDYTSVKIIELDFEIPALSQKGEVTTIEGIVDRVITGLNQDQVLRKIQDPENADKIDEFVQKLKQLKDVNSPFTIEFRDISGNCFIENSYIPIDDPNLKTIYFERTVEENHQLGIFSKGEVNDIGNENELETVKEDDLLEDLQGEVLQFPTNCPNCNSPCQTNMKLTNIPHFKEVIIMATICDACGHKTNDVKSGGGIEPKGQLIEVKITSKEDFSRDLLKSETCSLQIPELELSVGPHALSGRFTTVEGLIIAMKEQLSDSDRSFMFGDSQDEKTKNEFKNYLLRFDKILDGSFKATLVLNDPAGNSYVQSLQDDNVPDDNLKITLYERNYDQNEELGLNDIKTERY